MLSTWFHFSLTKNQKVKILKIGNCWKSAVFVLRAEKWTRTLGLAGFCRYLIYDALAMEENVTLDKYLLIYTGNHMKEYFDSLKNQFISVH